MILKKGDRIRLLKMDNDPNPITIGSEGTVTGLCPSPRKGEIQVQVKWDNGRTLAVLLPEDEVELIPQKS